MDIRPYDPQRDRTGLWALKRAFELELGGQSEASSPYAQKLTERYQSRYLDWVARCVAETPEGVRVAASGDELVGYAFLLPESLTMIWDAAVLNEIFVSPDQRGTGLADQLLTEVLAVAANQSLPMDRLVLDVSPENDRAVAFYERHGFEPWGDLVVRQL